MRAAMSSARSPRAMRVPAQSAVGNVVKKATLGSLFMHAA